MTNPEPRARLWWLVLLAAAGAFALPRAARVPVGGLLVACSLLASAPLVSREPRERGDDVVRALADLQRPGEPIVAADQRSAMALDHYVRILGPSLRRDVILPPDDAPADADRVWLLRRIMDGAPEPTDDDEILLGAGLTMTREIRFPGGKTDFVLQLWER